MLQQIIAFFRPNLGKVLSKFEGMIVKLEQVIEHEVAQEAAHLAKIAASNARIQEAQATVKKAETVVANIKGLLGE
jgi:F420-0:gamma-glutamyl ligase